MFFLSTTNKRIKLLLLVTTISTLFLSFSLVTNNQEVFNENKIEKRNSDNQKKSNIKPLKNIVKDFSKVNFLSTLRDNFVVNDSLENGVYVQTTIDSLMQHYANMILTRYRPIYGSIVVMNAKTGQIVALSNYMNPDSLNLKIRDSLLFINNRFPCASTFKTITLYSTLKNISNNSLDYNVSFNGKSTTLYKSQLLDKNNRWTRNFSIKQAYAKSANPVFGKLGIKLGKSRLYETAHTFYFDRNIPFFFNISKSRLLNPKEEYNLAEMGSGFNQENEISPIHAAMIFAPIANQKYYFPKPILFKDIYQNGKLRYNGNDSVTILSYLSPKICKKIEEAGVEVVNRGTARNKTKMMKRYISIYDKDWVFGGKTGNVNSDYFGGRTDWFIGFLYNKKTGESYSFSTVQIHGAYWNKHSSFIASEFLKWYIREKRKLAKIALRDSLKRVANDKTNG